MLGGMKLRLLVPAVAVALLLGACTDNGGSSSDSSAKKGDGEKLVEISPLTGQPMPNGRPNNPVLGEPQYNVDKADMVIEELVEGGLTRLAALYYSDLPSHVGHVRSLRSTDIGIAKPVGGKVVASGGAPKAARQIKKAGIRVFTESSPGFSRDAKAAPYNVVVNGEVAVGDVAKRMIGKAHLAPEANQGAFNEEMAPRRQRWIGSSHSPAGHCGTEAYPCTPCWP